MRIGEEYYVRGRTAFIFSIMRFTRVLIGKAQEKYIIMHYGGFGEVNHNGFTTKTNLWYSTSYILPDLGVIL